jgi:transposase-like protein
MTISFVARRHGISPSLLSHWRRRMAEGGKEAVRADDAVVSATEVRALEKRIRELGLVPCFTPVRSPESNGAAEAFVKSFKRDYVFVHDRLDTKTVQAQLPSWFEDCNESHPHKALRLKSPRELIRSFHQPAACPV